VNPSTNSRRIVVAPLGGTIACVPTAEGGVRPSPDPTFMRGVLDLSLLPVDNLPHAELLPSTGVASAELDIPRLLALAEQLEGHVDAGASGVVVTTGTDTLEEVAFALDLLWDRDEPLVVVGAMRHGALPGNDGPANLRDGLRVAAHPQSRGQGVLVTMGGDIHQAWQVRKSHSGALAAFNSAVSGPAGSVQEDTVRMTSMSVIDRPLFKLSPLTTTAPVALVRSALGDDGRILSVITAAGYRGLIIEVPGGRVGPASVDCEARAACPCHTRGLQPTNVLRTCLEIHVRQHRRRTQSAPNGHCSQRFTRQFEVAAAPSTVADHRSRRGRTRACIRHVRRTPNHRRPPRIPRGARRGEGLSTRALSVNKRPASGCWIDNTGALASLASS
jgi:L-asparaginase